MARTFATDLDNSSLVLLRPGFLGSALLCHLVLLASNSLAQDRWNMGDARSRNSTPSGSGTLWQGSDWLGHNGPSSKEWRLGVRGDNTDTGILVREIANNSAAAKARIEIGDVIVSVDGYQVGVVSGRLYDLTEELNRRANDNGVVTLLVQDHISGRLASIRAQLDSSQSTLRGTLVYRERAALPSDAIVTVQIENVTRPYYIVRNGQYSFRPSGGANMPFEISYDPSYIYSQDTYRVRAFVSSAGRTILDTPNPQTVITKGAPNDVRLQLTPLNSVVSTGGGNVVTAGYPNYNLIDDRISAMYLQYLGRRPTTLELAALHHTPAIESRLETMPIELMAAQEYFDLSGNNNWAWLERVFGVIVKRAPTQEELQKWMQYYENLRFSRTELLRELSQRARR